MDIVISFSPNENARLSAVARQFGLPPAELVRKLTLEHLPPAPEQAAEDDLDAKLSTWQAEDGVHLSDDVSAQFMFNQWAEEDAHMTEEQREDEDKFWNEFEASIKKTRTDAGMRPL